ncbi:AAA domain-containing protein [Variovorax paradoxus]|uniref:AAA domain-containing protein n=1 Tax=Variovorax paradoxus TaxID=34073 RepID=UPI000AC1C788
MEEQNERSEKKTITLSGLDARRGNPRQSFSDGRYITTRSAPRSGGLSTVYQATDIETTSRVAIKAFRSEGCTDEVIEESFRREVQALSDLSHPHIVRILDSGRDRENGAHFIVMEWVEQDLGVVMTPGKYPDWASYYASVGKGVLDALTFAHTRSTAHRDVKPSNVLLTEQGVVKLCDFGISKIRNFLAPGVTLARFASEPYSPPETDDGSYSYSRDVFGFAALSVAVLTGKKPVDYADLGMLLEEATIDEPIRRILWRCLELEHPELRPANAGLLQAELEQVAPTPASQALPVVLLALTNKVRSTVEYDKALRGMLAERFVERDLEGARMEEIPATADKPGRSFRLYGGTYGYIAAREDAGNRLLLISALEYQLSDLERRRGNAADPEVRFALSGASNQASSSALDGLLDRLLSFTADQKERLLEQRGQELYRKWVDLLSAKTELEHGRRLQLPYGDREPAGEFVRLRMKPGFDLSPLVNQDVLIQTGRSGEFRGKVVSRTDDGVLLRPSARNRIDAGATPEQGTVETDTTKTDAALDKQKAAVDAVRYGRSVNSSLGGYIVSPETVPVPSPMGVDFINTHIDEDKQDAVLAALSEPPLLLVEGPPGTGKTTFITELVLQTLKANPNARVLLTSQTHVALDNSLERIVGQTNIPVDAIRIGQDDDDRIAASARKLMLEIKLPDMRKRALSAGRAFMERWAREHGLNVMDVRRAMAMERHAKLKTRLEAAEQGLKELEPRLANAASVSLSAEERTELEDWLKSLSTDRDLLEGLLKESWKDLAGHIESKEELKEFSECSAADLHGWADAYSDGTQAGGQLKQLLQVHTDWEAAFGRSRDFQAAVIAASQVVAGTCLGVMSIPGRSEIIYDLCIVDEASIATPTEVLVPMSRARRTVLVGDSKQLSPFQDPDLRTQGLLERYELKPEDQKATLFNHLGANLPAPLKKTLTSQHRMLPAIGNLISECFYRDELRSIEREPAAHLVGVMPRPVTWYSTARRANRGSRPQGTSYYNDLEIEIVMGLLSRIDAWVQRGRYKDRRVTVAVLTGYDPQRARLQTAVYTKGRQWKSFSEIFVNVVDAFQGREADILVFSVTRSEVKGLGFLKEMERINVALSRGKELLAIVGDHSFCQEAQGATNPLRDVIDYIRRNPQTCALEEVKP